jgi:hypothetical protein
MREADFRGRRRSAPASVLQNTVRYARGQNARAARPLDGPHPVLRSQGAHLARGAVIEVAASLDRLEVGQAIARDEEARVAA